MRITSDTKVHPTFSMRTLPPPDVTRGSTGSVEAVLEASKAYTVDWQEARARMNEEVDRQLALANKLEGPSQGGASQEGGSGGGRGSGGGGRGGRGGGGRSSGGSGGGAGNGAPEASEETLKRLEEMLQERRAAGGKRPGEAFERAKARGETPFGGDGEPVVPEDGLSLIHI